MKALHLLGLAIMLAGPALAETADERLDRQCRMSWQQATALGDVLPLRGTYAGLDGDWCLFRDVAFSTHRSSPDVHIAEMRLRGDALGFFMLGEVSGSAGLQIQARLSGLRMVPQRDLPDLDYLYLMQTLAWGISAEVALDWDQQSGILTLSKFDLNFPGDNAVSMTAKVANVDLSTGATQQMSASAFAVTEASLDVTSKGLFESYLLIPLGALLLPTEGDMAAEVDRLRGVAVARLGDVPEASVSPSSKDAIGRLIQELPNPSGVLGMKFKANAGFGPARFLSAALFGKPAWAQGTAVLFDGVKLDVTWAHEDPEQ